MKNVNKAVSVETAVCIQLFTWKTDYE